VSNAIEDARKLIAVRLDDLESEAKGLETALASLGEGGSANGRRRKSAPLRRKRKAARAPRGQRREQFLATLRQSPGAKATEVAAQLGISASRAYALAGRLQKEGAIRKSGKGYRLAKATA